jgi:hypothetical protein
MEITDLIILHSTNIVAFINTSKARRTYGNRLAARRHRRKKNRAKKRTSTGSKGDCSVARTKQDESDYSILLYSAPDGSEVLHGGGLEFFNLDASSPWTSADNVEESSGSSQWASFASGSTFHNPDYWPGWGYAADQK